MDSILSCNKFFEKDSVKYIQSFKLPGTNVSYAKSRLIYADEEDLPTNCKSIKKRSYFPIKPRTDFEAEFPIAFARIVYKDYLFLEMELAASYQPQNFYCFMIDKKAEKIFHDRIHNLTKCFPNVIATQKKYSVQNDGHNMSFAHIECLYELLKHEWKYAILLQNHDTIIKTNYEIVQIFKWLNGSNDIETTIPVMERINLSLDWSFAGLNLFKNGNKNLIGAHGFEPKINWGKGYVECSLSRAMVDFMLLKLNLTKFMQQLEIKGGTDEFFISPLQVTDALNAPGGFTHKCIDQGIDVPHITRKTIWGGEDCRTKHIRRHICIFGVEDLNRILDFQEIFINKMWPGFDFGAIRCWYERMHYRNHVDEPSASNLNKLYYLGLPHVRFHYEKLRNGFVNLEKFNCTMRI